MVLVGVRLEDWKYVGGPDAAPSWPIEEKMLGVLCEEPALCTLSWLKARVEEAVEAAARGDVRASDCHLEARMRLEAVEAARRVRDAMVRVDERPAVLRWSCTFKQLAEEHLNERLIT